MSHLEEKENHSLKSLIELREIASLPPENHIVKDWKEQGRKVIGWLCTYTPEELIYAGDMLPLRVTGDSTQVVEAEGYLYANTCFFARSCLELGLQKGYDFLDGLIAGNTCDPIRRLYDVWQTYLKTPFTHILSIPHKIDDDAYLFFENQVNHLKERLEEFWGREITDESLRKAVQVYNKSRSLLMKIYELRQGESLLISGAEALDIVRASMRIPREQYNQLLEKLLIEIADRKPLSSDKVKLVISGSLLDSSEFIKTIEDLGGLVVSDDLCTGTRYFLELIDVDLPPLKGIARRYLGRPPCARMRPFSLRFNHLIEQVRKYQADAVIYEAIKFCDLYGLDKPVFKEELQALGIPVLELDLEYGGGGAVGQIRTRVEAFIEMLKSKKGIN